MLTAKLEQVEADIAKLAEEKARLEAEMKPKLMHGDYGVWNSDPKEFIALMVNGGLHWFSKEDDDDHTDCGPVDISTIGSFTLLGNIFDDIANRTKELKNFEINHATSKDRFVRAGVVGDLYGKVFVRIKGDTDTKNSGLYHFTPDELDEFITKLQEVRNCAKNR